MGSLDEGSVPPPGWAEHVLPLGATASGATAVSVPVGEAVQAPADAAVRWRISAAVIDNILVYLAYLLLCLVLGWRALNLEHLLALVVIGVLYHFVLESRDGQTIGKRQYGLRVVAVDDLPAGPKAIAVRSVLRIVDQLPTWYLSGLVNMVRTGPARRQRIGDVVANTKVVAVEGRSAVRGTPNWMLPTATLVALAFSALLAVAVAEAGHQPLTSAQTAQFVAGCEASTQGIVNCRCVLTRLEADGYVTLDELNTLFQQGQEERTTGQPGQARNELTTVGFACHD